jgi:hypothetical protein
MESPDPLVASWLGDLARAVLIGLVVTLIVAAIVAAVKPLRDRVLGWWRSRGWQDVALEQLTYHLANSVAYMTHLRDGVLQGFWRAQQDDPSRIKERIRRQILEPIRGVIPTIPAEEIKIVWFRPDDEAQNLVMYEQVGHTPEGQAALRIPIGSGFAGKAFIDRTTLYDGNCRENPLFHDVPESKAMGSLACVPIVRGGEATGVLSVLSNCEDAFWVAELRYFEALASAIGAMEVLEGDGGDAGRANVANR